VYLITEVGGRPPHVEVDSNEGKRALVVSPVPPDVFTIHKPHVRVKDQRRVRRRSNTAARPIAENFGRAENAIKVPNGGKLWCGAGQVYMENISVAEKVESPPGKGLPPRSRISVNVVLRFAGVKWFRPSVRILYKGRQRGAILSSVSNLLSALRFSPLMN
jgi:hypothetical protein